MAKLLRTESWIGYGSSENICSPKFLQTYLQSRNLSDCGKRIFDVWGNLGKFRRLVLQTVSTFHLPLPS